MMIVKLFSKLPWVPNHKKIQMKMKHQIWRNKNLSIRLKEDKGNTKLSYPISVSTMVELVIFLLCPYKESNDNFDNARKYGNDWYKGKAKHFKIDKYNKKNFITIKGKRI